LPGQDLQVSKLVAIIENDLANHRLPLSREIDLGMVSQEGHTAMVDFLGATFEGGIIDLVCKEVGDGLALLFQWLGHGGRDLAGSWWTETSNLQSW